MKLTMRALALAGISVFASATAQAGGARPVVVELFTSQGCNSCPQADAYLAKLSQRSDVLALSLPVTYWDMLGWKDTLATDANTRRQKAYAMAMGHGGVYTPQVIVDGVQDIVGSRTANIEAAIDARARAIDASIATADGRMAEAAATVTRVSSGADAPPPSVQLRAAHLYFARCVESPAPEPELTGRAARTSYRGLRTRSPAVCPAARTLW